VQPGTEVGTLLPSIASANGLNPVPVIAPATHDTGSAVAAVPAETRDYAYISSGTWSLMGVELDEPLVSDKALQYNFTNEGGVGPSYRFLKNIMGLWLVQECRRAWQREGRDFSYEQLTAMARDAVPFGALIEPDDERFITPGDMPVRIRAYCEETSQNVPADEGQMIRIVLESLALKYRYVLESLETILGRRLECIHVVGGGIQNHLLCRFTASATGRLVIAGPLEATGIGNLLLQLIGLGQLASLAEARQVVRDSYDPEVYQPEQSADWDAAYDRFRRLSPLA
jgi:rhamnulokinase